MIMALITPYYLLHRTPQGDRYAYPHPGDEPVHRDLPWSGVEWVGTNLDGDRVEVEIVQHAESHRRLPPWVIADEPLAAVVAEWSRRGEPGPWVKVDERPDGMAGTLWDGMSVAPSDEVLAHLGHYDDDCPDYALARQVYRREPGEPVPQYREFDLSHLVEFEAPLDPDPSRTWTVADPSALAVYGPAVAHTLPGSLPGFRDAVVAALKAHPLLKGADVYDHDRAGKVSVFFRVPWEVPLRRARRDGDRGRGPFYDRIARTVHVEHVVPVNLGAPSKARAIETWDATVAGWVERFVPDVDALAACTHCGGKGFHLPGEDRP
jgi:hypothetical protein